LPAELGRLVTFLHVDAVDFFHRSPGEELRNEGLASKHPHFGDVFHLAAVVGGRARIEGDPIAVARDLAIDAALFSWAVRAKPERLLYASSSAAYPINLQRSGSHVRLMEDFISFDDVIGLPDMTYGWSKLTGEYLARTAARAHGLHISCVRPFSGYGEDQDTSYPIPAIALRVGRREDPLHIWGSGEQARDFVYIDDCIEAMLRAIERISDGSAVNIGTGSPTTFRQIAEILSKIAGYSPRIQPLEDRPAGVFVRCADPNLARTLLDWEPLVTLEDGLERVYRFAVDSLRLTPPQQVQSQMTDVRRR
jgi:nucleoside-diphosphate-sugar epimerase